MNVEKNIHREKEMAQGSKKSSRFIPLVAEQVFFGSRPHKYYISFIFF